MTNEPNNSTNIRPQDVDKMIASFGREPSVNSRDRLKGMLERDRQLAAARQRERDQPRARSRGR